MGIAHFLTIFDGNSTWPTGWGVQIFLWSLLFGKNINVLLQVLCLCIASYEFGKHWHQVRKNFVTVSYAVQPVASILQKVVLKLIEPKVLCTHTHTHTSQWMLVHWYVLPFSVLKLSMFCLHFTREMYVQVYVYMYIVLFQLVFQKT